MHLTSVAETQKLALKLAKELRPGDILILQGTLGSGKTTLTQALGRGLGIRTPITSPTFVLRKYYPLPRARHGITALHHVDAYRLRTLAELRSILDDDMAMQSRDLWVIEWGKRFARAFPKRRTWLVRLTIVGEKERVVTVVRPPA